MPYYRAWIDFAPWSESDQLPDRRVFTPIVEWNGYSYTACDEAEKLEIGAEYCYGLTYWNDDCLPATATTEVSPATGTTDTLYTVTCNMGAGKYYAIQIRCDTTSAWQTLWEGNSLQCRYNSAGSYTPACRIDYERDDDADTTITVTEPTAALPRPATRPPALLVSARRLYRFISS